MQNTQNPFSLDPVRPPEPFYGRQRVTREVLNLLANGQHVSIVGAETIGKTSFLYHVADPEIRAQHGIAANRIFVYLDSRALASGDQETWYRDIEEATIRQLAPEKVPDSAKSLAKFEQTVQDTCPTPGRRVRDLFLALITYHIKPVLILDNFEALAHSPHMGEQFLSDLRVLATNYEVTYLVTSLLALHELGQIISLQSPFFNMFVIKGSTSSDLFGTLDPHDSRALIEKPLAQAGIKLHESVVGCILELGENRPSMLKRAGRIAVDLWLDDKEIDPRQHCRQIRRLFWLS
jgi:hypothetical protein